MTDDPSDHGGTNREVGSGGREKGRRRAADLSSQTNQDIKIKPGTIALINWWWEWKGVASATRDFRLF